MQILGFDFEVPPEYRVEGPSSRGERSHVVLVGPNARTLAVALVDRALAAGFRQPKPESDRVVLERGEQTIILVHDSGNLIIHTHDPTMLPHARFDGSAVLLGELRLECGTSSIVPLRERHLPSQHMRSGSWKLAGVSASQLVERVLDTAVTTKGLKRGTIFGPAKGGREVWSGEAYSTLELIKVRAAVDAGSVVLEIDLIDRRGEAEQ